MLYDADIICIENPADGSIGYCSVMGKRREHFALGAYFEDSGIFELYNIMENAKTILRYSKNGENGLEWQPVIPG